MPPARPGTSSRPRSWRRPSPVRGRARRHRRGRSRGGEGLAAGLARRQRRTIFTLKAGRSRRGGRRASMPTLTFLQMSDLHLDSALQSGRLGLPEEKARIRRDELRQIVPRALRLAREHAAGIILIPGDLFDDEAITQDTVNFVIDHLGSIDPIPVVIAPGNHDFFSLASPYNDELLAARRQRRWPPNVHIFRDGTWSTHLPPGLPQVTVTGMAHAANALLSGRLLATPIPRPAAARAPGSIHLLAFHGSRDHARVPDGKLRTLPFSETELASQGFDYAAVGHYHDHTVLAGPDGRVLGAYAGCPAGRGLDEEGDKHV